jgi:hypothetical protein
MNRTFVPLALLYSFACLGAQTVDYPKHVTVATKHGALTITNIQVINDVPDQPCGFSGRIVNETGVAWDGVQFEIALGGQDSKGRPQSLTVQALSELIVRTHISEVWGRCDVPYPAGFTLKNVSAKFIDGTPNPNDLLDKEINAVYQAKLKLQQKIAENERRQAAIVCKDVYAKTSGKRIADLTVKEEQSILDCRTLGLYRQ